jgi:hypothetical protein
LHSSEHRHKDGLNIGCVLLFQREDGVLLRRCLLFFLKSILSARFLLPELVPSNLSEAGMNIRFFISIMQIMKALESKEVI